MNQEYKTAELSNEALEKLQHLEGEMRTVADKNVVLIAYEDEKNHRPEER
ncbi:MAG TPA: hypothetical protein VFK33_02685 [Bacillales bacterium]|nr:hypothetical protein [Bacillales bacterium]